MIQIIWYVLCIHPNNKNHQFSKLPATWLLCVQAVLHLQTNHLNNVLYVHIHQVYFVYLEWIYLVSLRDSRTCIPYTLPGLHKSRNSRLVWCPNSMDLDKWRMLCSHQRNRSSNLPILYNNVHKNCPFQLIFYFSNISLISFIFLKVSFISSFKSFVSCASGKEFLYSNSATLNWRNLFNNSNYLTWSYS